MRTLTKAQFEKLSDNLIQATITPCKQAIKDAGISASDIDKVILVGGSTRIRLFKILSKIFLVKILRRQIQMK